MGPDVAIIALLDYNLSFKVLHADGRTAGWTAGWVKIMPLVAPTDQLKLDLADFPFVLSILQELKNTRTSYLLPPIAMSEYP